MKRGGKNKKLCHSKQWEVWWYEYDMPQAIKKPFSKKKKIQLLEQYFYEYIFLKPEKLHLY